LLVCAAEFIQIPVYCTVLWVGIYLLASCKTQHTHTTVPQVMTDTKEIK